MRLRLAIRGAVQGVGFRPFVHRLATELGLAGWVNNSAQGVFIEVEGARAALETFRLRLETDHPPPSVIHSLEATWLDPAGYDRFEIRPSDPTGPKTALVLPDIATCADCQREVFDPANRRYRYPFTNCTHCGPRFTIIEALPYDRPHTAMRRFTMCPACQAEYDDPRDRRFHAQPNACPACGPQLALWDPAGRVLAGGPRGARGADLDALTLAARAIRQGQILALKGLGGFQLLVAAHDEAAVRRLRERKQREEKPFALMAPSLDAVQAICQVSSLEAQLLRGPEAPIVLLRRLPGTPEGPAPAVAPGNPYLGTMLPYTPLHHLLLAQLQFPVVATSGNLSDEPICIDEHDALQRLACIADLFLVHDRPIVRHVDDSVVCVLLDRELVLRRARGYAPLPVPVPLGNAPGPDRTRPPETHPGEPRADALPVTLGVGAHLKNTAALAVGSQAFLSQHIGDLETEAAFGAFERVIADLQRLFEVRPAELVADMHPDYLSTQYALRAGLPVVRVQHHLAHVLACMSDNAIEPPALGVAWDGTGYGPDGTVWGGEFFLVRDGGAERVAHFRRFRLPGGDQAVKEPRRSALGVLFEVWGPAAFDRSGLAALDALTPTERQAFRTMLARGVSAPLTSSVGRLFDAVASLAGVRQRVRFEGQAAMELEFAADATPEEASYPMVLREETEPMSALVARAAGPPAAGSEVKQLTGTVGPAPSGGDLRPSLVVDWEPMIRAVLDAVAQGTAPGVIAARFHNALADAVVAVARRAGQSRVVLTGGCFQNRRLTEKCVSRLLSAGFRAYWHQRVPPNDGGIALGQVVAARLISR